MFPDRAYRRNFLVMGLDIAFFNLALAFSSVYGVLPLFVHHLSNSNLAVGLIATVRAAGFLLPPVLMADMTERRWRKKPLIMRLTTFERIQDLGLALVTVPLAKDHATLLLWLFFATIASTSIVGGAATPAWLDLIGRMMPPVWRGRFFGMSSAVGGLLGVGGGALAAELLRASPGHPTSRSVLAARSCF